MPPPPSIVGAAMAASVPAGSVFLTALIFAELYLRLPEPIIIELSDLFMVPLMILPATIVGFLLGLVPNLLGAALMAGIVGLYPPAWAAPAWAIVGAAGGALVAILFGAYPSVWFALLATSMVCALVCRSMLLRSVEPNQG